jgi:hypothetical protein
MDIPCLFVSPFGGASLGAQSEETTYDILKALSEIDMTLALLKATKVGAVVNRAKKQFSASSNAGELATTLVAQWKKVATDAEKLAASQAQPPSGSGCDSGSGNGNGNGSVINSSNSSNSSSSSSSSSRTMKKNLSLENSESGPSDHADDMNSSSPAMSPTGAESPRAEKADEEVDRALERLSTQRKNVRLTIL